MKNCNRNAKRLAEYNAFQKQREKLPLSQQTTTGKRRRKRRRIVRGFKDGSILQDLKGAPAKPKPTQYEDALARILDRHGVKYYRQFCIRLRWSSCKGLPKFAFLDFWVPSAGLAVEVDGYVHRDPAKKAEDQARSQSVRRAFPPCTGFYRLWNGEITEGESPALDMLFARLGLVRMPPLADALLMDLDAPAALG